MTAMMILTQVLLLCILFNYCVAAETYYSYDGLGNNENHHDWGAAMTRRVRLLPNRSSYLDGISIPRYEENSQLPSARRIMEQIFHTADPKEDKGTNHLLLEFGHFIVQDSIGRIQMNESEPFPMPCDGDIYDIVFCPVTNQQYQVPKTEISFPRSQHVPGIVPRATMNAETSFLDMSNMYGTTEEKMKETRTFEGGKVFLDEDGLPEVTLDKYNSSPGVFSLYVVFLRYHNYMAAKFAAEDTSLSDEELFQKARSYVIAVYQFNTEQKYIPTLLGVSLGEYKGYNPFADPSIDEFFATVSFRYAHTSFSELVRMLDEDFNPIVTDPLILRDVFRQPAPNDVQRTVRNHGGAEVFLRGLTIQNSKAVDASFVKDFNFFTEATTMLDIQRARDLGIPLYNDAREAFGLKRIESFDELTGYDTDLATALKNLYNNIDEFDTYVGALIEKKDSGQELGPLMTNSIIDQFERLRDGDRLWYRNIYEEQEWQRFPTLADIINITCEGMQHFPTDFFKAWDGQVADEGSGTCESAAALSLIDGLFSLGWSLDTPTANEVRENPGLRSTIDVTLIANEQMESPGYLGVGWRQQVMLDSEIWFCTVDESAFSSATFPDSCEDGSNQGKQMFSCCLAPGEMHKLPVCEKEGADVYYELEVVDWCLTPTYSRVVVRAPVCEDDEAGSVDGKVDCFRLTSKPNGEMDFIVAYNKNGIRNHGYQMRTGAALDLNSGFQTQGESLVADTGLIATHAIFMLFAWMVLAPLAIFIVRYIKTKSWRLVAHVSLMGIVGSLMVPLLIGVEASVGATDKTQEHSVVGIFLMIIYFFMVFAGRVRYLKLQGQKVGRKTYFFSTLLHKYGGVIIVWLSWWNCYTGLIRISPEDSYFQVWLLSSFSLGYNLPIFGFILQYIYFPYLAIVCIIFIIAEARRYRLSGSSHTSKLQGILHGNETLWEEGADKFLEKMTMSSFLDATRNGSSLCIVDGYVLDITNFMENHPGGQHLLRYAAGSDITEEFVGVVDVDGLKHVHTHSALELMRTFVTAVLVDDQSKEKLSFVRGGSFRHSHNPSSSREFTAPPISRGPGSVSRRGASVFRRGKIVGMRYLTPDIEITHDSKPVILMQLALPKVRSDLKVQKLMSLPSCAFTFRGVDQNRVTVDRQYTPVKISNDFTSRLHGKNEEVFDFIISLVPGGKMSKVLLDSRIGKLMLAQGPTVNPQVVKTFREGVWKSVVMIAAGTGISPMLQVIDFYLSRQLSSLESSLSYQECPSLYLMWIVKNPEYNYADALGLDSRVARSGGKFKYTIIYSSRKEKEQGSEASLKRDQDSKLKQVWTFKQIVDKTPVKLVRPSYFGMKKPKKVKREIIDNAKSTFLTRAMSFYKTEKGEVKNSSVVFEGEEEELTNDVWSESSVKTFYRSYNKKLLEELLLSIPKDSQKGVPSIIEDASKDNTSTTTTDSRTDSKNDASATDSETGEEEVVVDIDPSTIRPRSSWLPPASVEETTLEFESLDHKLLKYRISRPSQRADGGENDKMESTKARLEEKKTKKKKNSPAVKTTEGKDGVVTPVSKRPDVLEKSPDGVADMLLQLGAGEERVYKDSKILVAISGSPIFEYETKVILGSDLNFPKEQMVTFHASQQQL